MVVAILSRDVEDVENCCVATFADWRADEFWNELFFFIFEDSVDLSATYHLVRVNFYRFCTLPFESDVSEWFHYWAIGRSSYESSRFRNCPSDSQLFVVVTVAGTCARCFARITFAASTWVSTILVEVNDTCRDSHSVNTRSSDFYSCRSARFAKLDFNYVEACFCVSHFACCTFSNDVAFCVTENDVAVSSESRVVVEDILRSNFVLVECHVDDREWLYSAFFRVNCHTFARSETACYIPSEHLSWWETTIVVECSATRNCHNVSTVESEFIREDYAEFVVKFTWR